MQQIHTFIITISTINEGTVLHNMAIKQTNILYLTVLFWVRLGKPPVITCWLAAGISQ